MPSKYFFPLIVLHYRVIAYKKNSEKASEPRKKKKLERSRGKKRIRTNNLPIKEARTRKGRNAQEKRFESREKSKVHSNFLQVQS